jgi:TonB family protein
MKSRSLALTGTLLFHGLLLAFLLLWVIRTPIPPYPDTGSPGLEVNLGFSDDGMGEVQPDFSGPSEEAVQDVLATEPQPKMPPAAAEKLITQNEEDAPEMESPKESSTKNATKTTEPAKEETAEKPRQVNSRAMYGGKKGQNKGGNEGETGKPGDQGDPNGSRDARYHGPGGGTGDTQGDGNGDKGKGISYSLAGRKPQSLPVPKSNLQEEGRVVVEITVDPEGRVIAAKPGIKGSTTTNPALLEIARKAALSARFSASSDSPEEQKGTITYNFILR